MVSLEVVSIWLSAIQTVVVVLTLVGVIWQLRQFNRNMQNDAYAKVVEDYCRVSHALIERPHLNKLFYSDHVDFAALDSAQQDFYNYLAIFMGVLERAYLLFRKGWIDEQTWSTWERWLVQHWFRLDLFERFWKAERLFFTVDFYCYVDGKYAAFRRRETSST
jgi:hypothetical protein